MRIESYFSRFLAHPAVILGKPTQGKSSAGSGGEAGPSGTANILIRRNYDKSKVRLTSTHHIDAMLGSSLVVPEAPLQRPRCSSGSGDGQISSTPTTMPTDPDCMSSETQQLVINVPTSNAFEGLENVLMDDSDLTDQQTTAASVQLARKVRCPPIHVYGKTVPQLNQLLSTTNINQKDYLLRVGRSNIQIIIKTKSHFVEAVNLLRSNDVQFFTHGTSDDIPDKFVLSGLPKYDVNDVKTELENNGVVATEIKLLSATKTGDVASYLLQLPKGAVKLQELSKIKSLFNVVVYWRFYSRKKSDAVQCFRCQQYGHGMRNCNLQAKCVKCGERHLTKDCQLPTRAEVGSENSNSKAHIKCANCSQNHTANFKGCPSRLNYLKKLGERKARQPPNRVTSPVKLHQHTAPQNQHSLEPIEIVSALSSQVESYASVVRGRNSPSTEPTVDQGLFSVEEFTALALELFVKLSNCKTRASQFSALAELVLKFVYNGQP